MQMRSLKTIVLACALACASAGAIAGGGGIVFDPTNYIENLATAGATLKQEMLAIEDAVRQAQNLQNSIKNTVNTVTDFQGMGSIASDIVSLKSQWNVDSNLASQLGGQANFVQSVMTQYSALGTNGTFGDYVSGLATAANQGQTKAQSLFKNYQFMTDEVQKTMSQRQAIAQRNTGTLGTNDAIAATNASLDNLSEIQQATLQGITTLVGQQAYKQAESVNAASAAAAAARNLNAYGQSLQNDAQSSTSSSSSVNTIMGY